MTDPFVGQLAFFRVYSGKLSAGESVYNVAKGRKERVGRLVHMHANKREEIQEILAGDICAAVGLKTVSTGDTICDEEHPIVLESIDFPAPVIQLAVEPKTKADQEKLGMAIHEAGAGRSDLPRQHRSGNRPDHSGRHGRAAPRNHRRPHEARIRRGRQCRQAAGGLSRNHPQHRGRRLHAQEADRRQRSVRARASCAWSRTRARASSSRTKSRAARSRRNSFRPIEKGVVEALEGGILAGYPDGRTSRSRVFDGDYHDVDSSEMAFKICGSICVKEACAQGQAGSARAGDARSKWWCRKSTWVR